MSKSKHGDRVKNKILEAGVKAWLNDPSQVTASNVGRLAGMTHANVLYHFPYGIKDAVADYAIETGNVRIIGQLIATGHKSTEQLSPSDKMNYLQQL